MKTKHLFFATALVASFASCTNDDIIEVQQAANAERPTVDNVQLNFVGDGAESRLVFGADGYAWEADDVIGALNMDQPNNAEKWSSKYTFEDNINTSYPFSYNAETGAWGTPGKMLEGNYFFAFPFTDYEGERYAKYSLINQQQNGIKGAVVAENYAKNQVFIGYTPIKKGTGFDILTDIEMTSLLGAIQFRIVNDGDKAYHINKIVVRGTGLATEFKLNPTEVKHLYSSAASDATAGKFVAVNYLGKEFGGDKVTNTYVKADQEKETFKDNRMDYLRAVANYDVTKGTYVQLFVNGTTEERAVAKGATAYALVMANPVDYFTYNSSTGLYETTGTVGTPNTLQVEIYTDEGRITKDLLADEYIISTRPGVANTVKLSFTDADVKDMSSMDVYTSADLKQLISWNYAATLVKPIKATLKAEDVVLTKEAFELLKSNEKLNLTIDGDQTLTIADDVPADVLDYKGLTISTTYVKNSDGKVTRHAVAVEGTINFTKKSKKVSTIQALEGAVLNIAENSAEIPAYVTIDKDAELTMIENATVSGSVEFTNNGTMTVAKGGNILGTINNNAELTLNGKVQKLVNTGKVTMGANAVIASGNNNGTSDASANIITSSTAKVTITNNSYGRVKYVAGATIAATGGYVYDELTTATITDATYKDKGVNLFILTGGEVTISKDVILANVEVAESAVAAINVAKAASKTDNDKILTISTSLKIKKNATLTTNGATIQLNGETTLSEDAEWTNNATVLVNAKITNNGVVYNHATMKEIKAGLVHKNVVYTTATDFSDNWKITGLKAYEPDAATKQSTMDALVKAQLISRSEISVASFYNGNPYNVDNFISALAASWGSNESLKTAAAELWLDATDADADTWAEVLVDEDGVVAEEYIKSVNKVLDVVAAKVKAILINKDGELTIHAFTNDNRNATLWKTQKDAYDNLRYELAKNATLIAAVEDITDSDETDYYVEAAKDWTPVCIAAAAWRLTDEEIEAALAKTMITWSADLEIEAEYFYIWEGNKLDAVMDVYRTYANPSNTWSGHITSATTAVTDMASLRTWMDNVVGCKDSSIAIDAAKAAVKDVYTAAKTWYYSADQVQASGKKGINEFED